LVANQKIRVLVAEDHELVQAGLRMMLEETPDLTVSGFCVTARDAKAKLDEGVCDVLLCDISLPDGSGLELLSFSRTHHPEVGVLVHSSFPESQFGLNALKAGAAGYIGKGASKEELLRAIRTVARKQRYISPALSGLLVDGVDGGDQPLHTCLSEREFTVMRRLAAGESATAIGASLKLSVKTVSTYRTRILEKLGMKTNADLTRYCLQSGLAELDSSEAVPEA
jgi:two-component system, NarL family, invasion response regulator UvrY